MDLVTRIRQKAATLRKTIILPESEEPRVLQAAAAAVREGIAGVILIGGEESVNAKASEVGVSLDGVSIVDPSTHRTADKLIEMFYELRKHKGVTEEEAREIRAKPIYFAAMMVHAGEADGYVAGSINPTSRVLKPAFQIIKMRKGISAISAFSIMILGEREFGCDGVIFYCDTGVHPDPDARELAEQAVLTAESFEALVGERAKVAMCSFSTKGSAKHAILEKVIEATERAKKMNPDLLVDGEMQIDAALVKEVGKRKAPESPVAGEANCLILPDLNCGNIAYKITERLAGARAIGPITQGLNKPANDLSRGCSSEDVLDSIAVTAVQSSLTGSFE
jgi:phosphate acetyltransferase